MYVYIDESGHTGFNLFDPEQPYFLNVAMSSLVDFDDVFGERVQLIAAAAGVSYLHASDMGWEGVESIARDIIELVRFSQARFYFAVVNKQDVAAIKFYDAIFDPSENLAAPRHSYLVRSLRFVLLLKFHHILDPDDLRLFWEAMTSTLSPTSERKAVEAIDNTLQRVSKLPDARSRQLVGDTLHWAKNNISKFSIWTPRKQLRNGHLPNLFTFPMLLTNASDTAKLWDSRVDRIVHDQQSQFQNTLRHWHSLFQNLEPEWILHIGDTPIRFGDIGDSEFELRDSQQSPGLQVVDLVLWTFSRVIAEKPIGPNSKELVDLCFSPDALYIMSLARINNELKHTFDVMMDNPPTEDQLSEGMKIIEYVEELRQQSILTDSQNQEAAP